MTTKLFSELGLSDEILKAIDKLGYEQASPIQAAAIPELLAGRDVVGQSQTGSGKTAAFAIPAIEKINPGNRVVQALILCPTRELAVQISEEFHKLTLFKRGLNALPIYGGQAYDRQIYGLKQGAQIVIGTPGRVMDHMRRGTLQLDAVRFAVLDEVDVMLNMGFRDDIEAILKAVPKERQTVFFSATIPRPIRQLIDRYARDPKEIRIEQKAMTVPTVEQIYYEVDSRFKVELLERLIDIHDLKLGLIFCNTKRMVDELADRLEAAGYMADRLHGDMTQAMRDRVMNKFRKSGLEFLVATDVAARGIDVDDIQVVFNYDLPYDGEDYVHRIGRTGRAGRGGRAISFVAGRELFQIRNIERYANTRIHRGRIPTEGEVEEARRSAFLLKLRAMLQAGEFRKENPLLDRLLDEGFASTDIASACMSLLQSGEQTGKAAGKSDERHVRSGRSDSGSSRIARPDRPALPPPVERSSPLPLRIQALETERPEPRPAPPAATAPAVVRLAETAAVVAPEPVAAAPAVRREHRAPEPKSPYAPAAAARRATPPPRGPAERRQRSDDRFAPAGRLERGESTPRKDFKPRASGAGKRTADFGSRKSPRKAPPPAWVAAKRGEFTPAPAAKVSRATPPHQTRLWMNLGETMAITPRDVVNAIAGETGLEGKVVGTVDVRERHLFVDVAKEHASTIVSKLNRSIIKGTAVKVKVA